MNHQLLCLLAEYTCRGSFHLYLTDGLQYISERDTKHDMYLNNSPGLLLHSISKVILSLGVWPLRVTTVQQIIAPQFYGNKRTF